MESRAEKVFVALGNDLQDGLKTLDWTLKKWNFHSTSIVILHLPYNSPKDFVYTPCKSVHIYTHTHGHRDFIFSFCDGKCQMGVHHFIDLLRTLLVTVGKLPASFVNDEKVEVLNKYEKEKMDKLLSEYKSFCGKVLISLFLFCLIICLTEQNI